MRTVCIYHNNCFDGICAAWVVSKIHPNAVFIPMNYSDPIPQLEREDDVLMVDFCLKAKDLQELAMRVSVLTIIDHHKTAQKELDDFVMSNVFIHFDMNESGASLAWKVLFPNKDLPVLIEYIKDRDLWLFKEQHSQYINAYIQSFPMTIERQDLLYEQLETDEGWTEAYHGGQAIERYKQTMVKAMCKNAAYNKDWPFYNDRVPIVNASMLFSEVGNELCKMYPDAPFAAYYFDRLKDNVRQWGLRSIGDFDVSEVAKKLGGGGHKNAAGFEQSLSAI